MDKPIPYIAPDCDQVIREIGPDDRLFLENRMVPWTRDVTQAYLDAFKGPLEKLAKEFAEK